MHQALQQAFQEGRLLKPDPGKLSVVDAVNALAHLAGVTPPNPTDHAADLADQIGPAEHLFVVLALGLSDESVLALPGDALLKKHRCRKLRHVVPSGTATLLTTLATGLWPGQHGMFGRWTYVKERQRWVHSLAFTELPTDEPLASIGLLPTRVFREMPLWVDAQAEPVTYVDHADKEATWAQYLSGYRTLRGCSGLADAWEQHLDRIDGADGPTIGLVVLNNASDAQALSDELDRLAINDCGADVTCVVLGGGAALSAKAEVPLSTGQLQALDAAPAVVGEPRCFMVLGAPASPAPSSSPESPQPESQAATDAGSHEKVSEPAPAVDPMSQQLAEQLGPGVAVVPVQQAVDAGWFGPEGLTQFAEKRAGSHVVIAMDRSAMPEPSSQTPAVPGGLGGLTPMETICPLIVLASKVPHEEDGEAGEEGDDADAHDGTGSTRQN